MKTPVNHFIISRRMTRDYFCDRVEESDRLIKTVTNGNNLVLISPRRMGKAGLIRFCYGKSAIKSHYHTFFIDILHTSSLRELTYLLGRAIYETLLSRGQKAAQGFLSMLRSLSGSFRMDPFSGMPSFNIELGDIHRPEYTLEEIFRYLENADKPCIVAIDEFQQIAKYPEKNIEALLRTHIQQCSNSHFIFAGSERHMMQAMFLSAARPFYHSADMLELKAIVSEAYVPFVVRHFKKRHRSIHEEAVQKVYDLFRGHTYYMQKTFNEAFANTSEGATCTMENIRTAIGNILAANDTLFREILSNIPEKQKLLLYAIARDGEAEQITSAAFVKRHRLASASSVQSAIAKLLEKDIVTEINKVYAVTDKFFRFGLMRYMVLPSVCKNHFVRT